MGKITLVVFGLLFSCAYSASADELSGYLVDDVKIGSTYLYKGQEITCRESEDENCCVDTFEGGQCFSRSLLSPSKVPFVDIRLQNVKGSMDLGVDACTMSEEANALESDHFIRNYSFVVSSSQPIAQQAYVELAIQFSYEGKAVDGLSIIKQWNGVADGKCHSMSITNEDFKGFLKRYESLKGYLNIESDGIVYADLKIKAFSQRKEDDYANNLFESRVAIPTFEEE